MTDMQTSLPLLIVRPSILNPVMHFSTQPLTGEMKCPTSHTFALRIPFHLPKCWCHTSTKLHQAFWSSSWVNTWLDLRWMIWSTSHHHVIESSNWSLVLFSSQCQVKTMKSKYYNIQVSFSSCDDLLEIFDGLQIYLSWILFWMKKIILHIGKWVKCHWHLKNDLETNTYDI